MCARMSFWKTSQKLCIRRFRGPSYLTLSLLS
jgi:hypothetical protein